MSTISKQVRLFWGLIVLFSILMSACGGTRTPGMVSRECEYPDKDTVGQMVWRSNASGSKVHGQLGTAAGAPWPAKPGYVEYNNLNIPGLDALYLELRYSKDSPSTVPILVYVDDEATQRATLYPVDQGDWNHFVWTEPIPLGSIVAGIHSIKLSTDGQQYGVADLDSFVLTTGSATAEGTSVMPGTQTAPIAENDLLVWYDFEGDFLASGTIVDRSGNGQDAQVNGSVDVAEGIAGGQAIFFSRNGYIQAQSNPAAGRSNVSFSLWFKTDQPGENYKLASAAWWNWGPGSGWIVATHIPEFWSDDTKSLYLPEISNNENHFPAGEWVHEVVTYDGQRIREYANGRLVNDWPTTGAAIGQGQAMIVGAWPPFSAYDFHGSIDEFQVFARGLTQQEVETLYDQGR